MADSRRINTNIREEESKLSEEEQPPLSLSSLILSSEFWPPLKEEKLELPPLVVQSMEAYTHRYEKLKVKFTCSSVLKEFDVCGMFSLWMWWDQLWILKRTFMRTECFSILFCFRPWGLWAGSLTWVLLLWMWSWRTAPSLTWLSLHSMLPLSCTSKKKVWCWSSASYTI